MKNKSLFALFLLMLLSVAGFSQDRKPAIISGTVKDARTKAPLKEAVVTISSDAFEGQRFALTDSSGMYRINNLPAGTYVISFEMEGYKKFTQESIALKEGMSLGVSFEMIKEQQGRRDRLKERKEQKDSTSL